VGVVSLENGINNIKFYGLGSFNIAVAILLFCLGGMFIMMYVRILRKVNILREKKIINE